MTVRHVVMFSSGAGSWAAARRVADEHGTDGLVLLFADVAMEDEDNYRFLHEAAADIGGELVIVRDGRDIWEVFKDRRMLGNTRIANCSTELKQKPARAWLDEHCDPAVTTVYVGIDWTESHRLPAIGRAYQPFRACAPLTEPPYLDKAAVLADLRARGIEPPRLYGMGFAHANCGGGCVRAGQGQFAHLLKVMPERYAEWERNEQDLREHLGKDVAILRDRTRAGRLVSLGLAEDDVHLVTLHEGYWSADDEWHEAEFAEVIKASGKPLPVLVPLTLRTFRERHEAQPEQTDLFDIGGCGCFTAEGVAS